jgi:V/A-type H+-transporting ATPase subunit I
MKKYTFVVFHNDYEDFLRDIQGLGVVHVVEKKEVAEFEHVRGLSASASRISRALQVLKKRNIKDVAPANDYTAADTILAELDRCQQEIEKLDQALVTLKKEITLLQPWGDVPTATVEALAGEHICAHYFSIPKKKFSDKWLAEHAMAVVHDDGLRKYCVLFVRDGEEAPVLAGAEELRLPARVLSVAVSEREKVIQQSAALSARIDALAAGNASDILRTELARVFTETDYTRAVHSGDAEVEGHVRVLQGWVPKDREAVVTNAADAKGVVTMAEDPQEGEKVPIELKNGPYTRLFEPIAKLFDFPSYAELDLTAMFAPFFMLFFGLCLGDGGYGAVIFIASFIAYLKVKKDFRPLCMLGMVFGGASLLVGVFLLGGVFGMELSEKLPNLQHLFLFSDKDDLFMFAILIGVVQILFGMGVRIVSRWRQFGFLKSLVSFGWFFILLGLMGMIGGGELSGSLGEETALLVGTIGQFTALFGVALILFFNDLKVNIFLRVGKGVWELYNITGVVGDILSYVRLFALGIAGGILGAVVNQMSAMFLDIPILGIVLCGIFLCVGHIGVLLLSTLGAFVHPMRLTFVEFYKNAGFTGGGKAYKPLATRKIK